MSVANPKTSLSVRDQVSKDEWEVRVNLAAAYRLVAPRNCIVSRSDVHRRKWLSEQGPLCRTSL
jgi:hypothetical protein